MNPAGAADPPPSRLSRQLGLADAVTLGLGSMIGAGVFSAFGPAAGAAGSAMLAGLVLAAGVAYLNASASARLAALHPEAGGTYAYGRRRLGEVWGFVAGWAFVAGRPRAVRPWRSRSAPTPCHASRGRLQSRRWLR